MKRAATAALILSLFAATAALADARHGRDDRRDDHGRYEHRHHEDRGRDHKRFDRDHRYHHGERNDHRRYDDRFRAGRYHAPAGYRHRHWGRGDRLPRAYYSRPYIVHDYHSYRLRRPPRGCHYVRVNNDVVLAAIATGVILDVFYNHFY